MKKDKWKKNRNKKYSMKKEGTFNLPRLKNCRPIKIGLGKNMKEGSYNIVSQSSNKYLRKKELLAEYYQSST